MCGNHTVTLWACYTTHSELSPWERGQGWVKRSQLWNLCTAAAYLHPTFSIEVFWKWFLPCPFWVFSRCPYCGFGIVKCLVKYIVTVSMSCKMSSDNFNVLICTMFISIPQSGGFIGLWVLFWALIPPFFQNSMVSLLQYPMLNCVCSLIFQQSSPIWLKNSHVITDFVEVINHVHISY